MSCLIKKHIITYMFFFFCFAFVSVLYSPGVNAIEDLTGTLDNSITTNTGLCDDRPEMNLPLCSDYNYLILETSSSNLPTTTFWNLDFNAGLRLPWSPYMVFDLTDVHYIYTRSYASWASGLAYTYTFTESLGSGCPDPEPCPSCPVCPVVPENPYDEKLDEILHAVYIGIASLFVLYFFYCIYRMIIKGVK